MKSHNSSSFLLTARSVLLCDHGGRVAQAASQDLVFIEGEPTLVEGDSLLKPIRGCPNAGPTIKPCGLSMSAEEGLSGLIRIEGRSALTDSLVGGTDGTPPMATRYRVAEPGQRLVTAEE